MPDDHYIEGNVGEEGGGHQLADHRPVGVPGEPAQPAVLAVEEAQKAVPEHGQRRLADGDAQRLVHLRHVRIAQKAEQGQQVNGEEAEADGHPQAEEEEGQLEHRKEECQGSAALLTAFKVRQKSAGEEGHAEEAEKEDWVNGGEEMDIRGVKNIFERLQIDGAAYRE